ncbi:MAG TPA: right-handed parallel beta-helix repeat-containing protein [Polyangiaceae bacterium]
MNVSTALIFGATLGATVACSQSSVEGENGPTPPTSPPSEEAGAVSDAASDAPPSSSPSDGGVSDVQLHPDAPMTTDAGDAGSSSGPPVLPGTQTPVDPGMTTAAIQSVIDSVGSGNTVVFAPGTYPGPFTIRSGVYLYSSTNGGAVVQGTLDGTGANGWTVNGFTVDGALVQASSSSGARITRCTFDTGTDIGDGFGAGSIRGAGANHLTVDHNAFNGVSGTTVQFWNLDDSTVTLNTFTNCRQGIDPDFSEGGHGNDTLTSNYFTGTSRMPIETSSGGASGFTFSNIVVTGNWAESFVWPSTGDTSGNVAYSIVGGDGVLNATISGNTVLGNGSIGIGIELNQTGTVTGNRIDDIGYSGVEVYAASGFDVENNDITNCAVEVGNYQNGAGTIQDNEDASVHPSKPVTGPSAP